MLLNIHIIFNSGCYQVRVTAALLLVVLCGLKLSLSV